MQGMSVRQFAVSKGLTISAVYQRLWVNRVPGAVKHGRTWRIPIEPSQPATVPDFKAEAANDVEK